MYLIAIAWMYVVLMMAAAEALSPRGTFVGAFFTLLLYGVLPLGILLYIMGAPGRGKLRRAAEAAQKVADDAPAPALAPGSAAPASASAEPGSAAPGSPAPDGGRHAARDAVAPVGKEI